MKRMAFVMAVVAMAGCAKGEQKPAAAADSSNMMMTSDSSHMMMSDSSKMTMAPPDVHMSAESTSVERGATVYKNKGCAACHNIAKSGEEAHRRPGGKQSGPDLGGVTERRDRGWLRRWLKDPDAMLVSDPAAIAMLAQAKNLKMPNMKLSDSEIEAVINYLGVKQ